MSDDVRQQFDRSDGGGDRKYSLTDEMSMVNKVHGEYGTGKEETKRYMNVRKEKCSRIRSSQHARERACSGQIIAMGMRDA